MRAATELAAADAYCRIMAGRHYENFWVAAPFLAPGHRRHLARIYAYSRTTDDAGDESGRRAPGRLAAWRAAVESMLAGAEPLHPVLIAIRRSVVELGIPGAALTDLIAANEQDQRVSSYESWEELREYCALSAAPVGRMVLRAFGAWSPDAERLSDDVCVGLQLANFAQDVAVDRAKGRTYLLQAEVRAHGVRGAVKLLSERASRLLASGEELETRVPGRLRIQLALYRLGGLAVLEAIRRADFDTERVRPVVSAVAKLRLVPAAAARLRATGKAPGERAGAREPA
ncbi:MAG: squalene/phytoene synthase family protein [Candidatus Dormibacterales bacterium]